VNLTRPPLPSKPPREPFYAAVHELHKLDPEPTACAFAEARFGPVRTCEAIPTSRGLYALECTTGRCYVALVGVAEIEGRGLDGSEAVRQREQLLIAVHGQPAALEREILITPRSKRSELRRAYVGYEALGRRVAAWVASDQTEWSTMALASGPLRRYIATRLGRSEREVYEQALSIAREHCWEFVAELLPYPPSAYQAALAAAAAEAPVRARAYAREVVRATLSGERHAFAETPAPRSSAVSSAAAANVRRSVDAAVNRIRHQHLPCGTRVQVVCWEDEEFRAGTVVGVQYGASSPTTVDVDYPDGYRSPRAHELINPSSYPLSRIKVPPSPLHGLAADAKREPLEPRRFT
jgi:hypothetical protein